MTTLKLFTEPGHKFTKRELSKLNFPIMYYNAEEPQLTLVDRLRQVAEYINKTVSGYMARQCGHHIAVFNFEDNQVAIIHETKSL